MQLLLHLTTYLYELSDTFLTLLPHIKKEITKRKNILNYIFTFNQHIELLKLKNYILLNSITTIKNNPNYPFLGSL